jgi:subtilisin family serine protease
LVAYLSLAWAPVQTEPVRLAENPKIDRHLHKSLYNRVLKKDNGDHKTFNVWIFFTDKSLYDDRSLRRAVSERARGLDPHTRLRRLKVRNEESLVDFADLAVSDAYVQEVLKTGAGLRNRSRWLNALSVRATQQQIGHVASLPFVARLQEVAGYRRRGFEAWEIESDRGSPRKILPFDYGPSYTHLNQIAVPQLHQWLQQNGFGPPGEGVRICLLDTGFELYHEALDDLDVVAQRDFINGDDDVSDEAGDPQGQSSHGTTVLSIIGGYAPGKLIGTAHGATYLLGKTEVYDSETPIEEDYWVAGLEWAEELGADVVSSSLGYLDWYDYSDMDGRTAVTTLAADLAVSRGVVVVNAAGNEGRAGWKYIIAPADGHRVIAVGAVDTLGIRAPWSSQGPTSDGRTKPDVMACGVGTYAVTPYNSDGYWRTAGTSVATPLVAGVAALLLQADSTLTPTQVSDALRHTASRASHPDNYYGWGIVDADAARWGISPPALSTSEVQNYPNPFSENTRIFFPVSGSARATVSIYTVSGELVRKLDVSCELEGSCEAPWDGRNQSGEEVADGIYICQVVSGGRAIRGKLVRLSN